MASSTSVPDIPASDCQLANLTVVSYDKILCKDSTEAALLFSACADQGFFYLDLGSSTNYQEIVNKLFEASKDYFSQPLEQKLKDKREDLSVFNICGFKPLGPLGLDAGNVNSKKNGCEHLRIPVDVFFNPHSDTRLHFPLGLSAHQELLKSFISDSHALANTILSSLSTSLNLGRAERFENYHRPDVPSTSIAALQYYPLTNLPEDTSAGHFAHTDTGSLTILFNTDWGLQAYSSARKAWEYVAPRENCAIINVGDALKFISGFRLESSLHRVVPWHRPSTASPRYASIFFLRPNHHAEFMDSEGVKWTANRWLEKKFQNYRLPHAEQETNAISTGKKGFTGLLE